MNPDSTGGRFQLFWIEDSAARREIGAWIGKYVALDKAYISHGEIQTGLSLDGQTWISDVSQRVAQDIENDVERSVLEARDTAGTRVGAAIVLFQMARPTSFAVIEDVVVKPDARRRGVAEAMLVHIESQAKRLGLSWIMLESGLANKSAHALFEGKGFAPISKVFAKRLEDAD
jgi:ribosomal protein S18 acetylase RimI-like enzyme